MSESMFVGPKNEKIFGPNDPYWVPEPSRWNRDLYYRTETHMVEVISLEETLDLKNLSHVEGVSGVWSIWGRKSDNENLVCLDVHETLDVGYEIRMHDKDLLIAAETPWNDPIYTDNNLFSLDKRSKAISQWRDLEYRLVAINLPGKINREAVEAQYAWDNKAVYWNRNYFQPVTIEQLEVQMKNEYIKKLR